MRQYKTLAALVATGEDCRDWYDRARLELIYQFGNPWKTAAGVAGCLSIRNRVSRMWKGTTVFMESGRFLPGTLGIAKQAAYRWIFHGTLPGPKVRDFVEALWGNPRAVAIDVWVARGLGLPDNLSTKQYQQGVEKVHRLSSRLNWTPAHTQAALWAGSMRENGRNPFKGVPWRQKGE